jgi:glycosyltransferase involved in cell wall biosynthesis/O-antigen/teichoic acid export membrane protein
MRSGSQIFQSVQTNLFGKSVILFGGLMVGNVAAYVYHMLTARMMTPADYGALVTLTSISMVLNVLMRTFQAWVIKAIPSAQGTTARHVRTLFGVAMRTLVPWGCIAFALHWVVSQWVADFLHLGSATPVIMLGLFTLSSFLIPVPRGILLGLRHLHAASMIQILDPSARLVAGVTLIAGGFGVSGAVTGYTIGHVFAFAAAVGMLLPLFRQSDDQTSGAIEMGGLDRYALVVLVTNACLMIIASIDQIAVKRFFSEEVAGNYAVAFLLGRVIMMNTIALGWVIFARSATMTDDDPRRVRVLMKALLATGVIAVTLTTAYLAGPALAVRLMGGAQYDIAAAYVGLVGIEMTLFSFVYVQAYYLISIKKMHVVWPLLFTIVLEITLLARYHTSVDQILLNLIWVIGGLLIYVSGLSWWTLHANGRPAPALFKAAPSRLPKSGMEENPGSMKTACMIVHAYYPADPRVRRETEALLDEGWTVDVICLRDRDELPIENCSGATVYRQPIRRHRGRGVAVYLLEYLVFFVLASFRLAWLFLRHGYDVVQVHNMPDFLVFTALLPRLFGTRVVLDIHDVVPELYMSKFGGDSNHPVVRMTRWVERRSIAFADHVITAGQPFQRKLIARGVPPHKVTVILNSADPRLFHPVHHNGNGYPSNGQFTLMYHGGLFERYGLDIAIRAVHRLRDTVPGLQLHIYGRGEAEDELGRLIAQLDLGKRVRLGGFVPIDDIPELITKADLGVVPYRQDSFTDLLYPTKAFEYMAMGVPVILARTGAVVELFADVPDMFFQPDNVDDLAARILTLYQSPERRHRLLDAACKAYAPYTWESQRKEYLTLMQRLTTV